jgi:hypothetical protein
VQRYGDYLRKILFMAKNNGEIIKGVFEAFCKVIHCKSAVKD